MGKILSVANHKGGVGKTSMTVALASVITWLQKKQPERLPEELRQKPVLLVDTDPQANTTEALGVDPTAMTTNILDFYKDPARAHTPDGVAAIVKTRQFNISIIPSSIQLEGITATLPSEIDGRTRLREVLAEFRPYYSLIIIDTPPSLGVLTQNALVASDDVLVPLTLSKHAILGVSNLITFLDRAVTQNPDLHKIGILINAYDKRYRLQGDLLMSLKNAYRDAILSTIVPTSARIVENIAKRKNILNNVIPDQRELLIAMATEILQRMGYFRGETNAKVEADHGVEVR